MPDEEKNANGTVHVEDNGIAARIPRAGAAKRWIFTINFAGSDGAGQRDLAHDELATAAERFHNEGRIVYLIAGREVGANGTHHIQGYMELAKRERLAGVKRYLSPRAHCQVARGTPMENRTYCSKDGVYFEVGVLSTYQNGQGSRTDLVKLKEDIDSGKKMTEIADEHFSAWLRMEKGIRSYVGLKLPDRDWMTEMYIYWGDTGTGKTWKAHEENKETSLYVAFDNNMVWFDGYEGQEAVLFDDFDRLPDRGITYILRLIDRYSMRVPIKGGSVKWLPRRVYFTSNTSWEEWGGMGSISDSHKAAFKRRITKVIHFTDLHQ